MERYKSEYRKQNRIVKFIKEYNGLVPVLGGLIVSGAAGVIAFAVGSAQSASDSFRYLTQTGDFLGTIGMFYQKGSELAGKYALAGYVGGQFVSYKLKKTVSNFFAGILGR
jgi:hypothetical protein